jgi:16S rRNA G966 N2-methylase RsmD
MIILRIVSTFGQAALRNLGKSVIDIAGGNGGVSFELSVRYGIEATLVEPREAKLSSMERRRMKRICKWREREANEPSYERLQHDPLMQLLSRETLAVKDDGVMLERVLQCCESDQQTLPFQHVQLDFPLTFNIGDVDEELLQLLRSSALLIGMHSDQVTESIVDAALALNLSFAVVPCCVFPHLFPHRKKPDGSTVTSTQGFIEYLQEKHPSITKCYLPFNGQNVVLYRKISPHSHVGCDELR